MLTSGCYDNTVNVYTASDLKIVKTLTDHTGAVRVVSFSGDGRWLASGSSICHVIVYDVQKDFALVKKIKDHTSWVSSLCFTSNSRHLLTGSYDKSIKVYDCSDDFALIQSIDGAHNDTVASLSISGKYLASGSFDRTVKIWTLEYK
jgi:WD40 repeat protein